MSDGHAGVPDGESVFVDANVIYHFLVHIPATPELCAWAAAVLQRVARGDLVGHTSTGAVADAIHKVMMAEATARFLTERAGAAHRLNRRPDWIKQLDRHVLTVPAMEQLGVTMHPVTAQILHHAAECSTQFGLLTNDAIIAATMQRLGIRRLATLDDDFARVPWVSAWMPAVR